MTKKQQQRQDKITIKPHDVLCGRGGHSNNHPGNKLFRRIILENKEIYQELSDQSAKKHILVSSIIQAIQRFGGRFIRKQGKNGDWVVISEKEARAKTTQALREHNVSSQSSGSSSRCVSPSPLHSQFREALKKSPTRSSWSTPQTLTTSPSTTKKGHVRRVSRDFSVAEEAVSYERRPSTESLPQLVKENSFDSSFGSSGSESTEEGVWAWDDAILGDITDSIEGDGTPLLIEDFERLPAPHPVDMVEEDPFCPLNPNEIFFESASEFGTMCLSLLENLVQ